jgi:hypothetical protein
MTEAEALETLRAALAAEGDAEATFREAERARRAAHTAMVDANDVVRRARLALHDIMRGRSRAARRQGDST